MHGVLANIINSPKEYETAIEMSLGAALQNIVTDTEADAKRGINFLKTNNFGRATFLPISSITSRDFKENNFDDIYDLFNETYPGAESINYSGRIHNFCYINVFDGEGTLLNEVPRSSYAGTGYNDGLADWDLITYGHYMQRSTHNSQYVERKEGYRIEKKFLTSQSQYDNVKWSGKFSLTAYPIYTNGFSVGEMTKIDMYDLLPEGMEFDSSKAIEISSTWNSSCFSGDYSNWTQFLKDHTTTEIEYNYNNTNRTRIHISTDFTGYNVSTSCSANEIVVANIPVYVPYDALAEYGLDYTNYGYINPTPDGGVLSSPYSNITSVNFNNGKKWFAPLLVNVRIRDNQFHSFAMSVKCIGSILGIRTV